MFRFQYSVITEAEPGLCWDVFADCSRWNTFADIYGSIEWTEGPLGSRVAAWRLRFFGRSKRRLSTSSPAAFPASASVGLITPWAPLLRSGHFRKHAQGWNPYYHLGRPGPLRSAHRRKVSRGADHRLHQSLVRKLPGNMRPDRRRRCHAIAYAFVFRATCKGNRRGGWAALLCEDIGLNIRGIR